MAATTTLAPAPATRELTSAGLGTVLLGAALAPIDGFIVNVALPTIDADLHAGTSTLQWVVAGYGVAFALMLVIGGRLGDAFGRRRLFMVGLAAFTLTSLVCGLAPTAGVLVVARIAQGGAAAMLVPQVLSILQASTAGAKRARVLGLYGATGGIAMVIGQLLGGVLTTADIAGSGWRPIFLVNVPIGVAGLLLARRTVPESRAAHPLRIDRLGTVLLAGTLFAVLVPAMEGESLGWPLWCWALLAVAPFAAAAFVAVERRREGAGVVPLLPPALLQLPSMRRGLALAVPFFVGFGGFLFVFALTLQDGLHLGPLGSGLALTPLALAFLVASLSSSRLAARFGFRLIWIGASLQLVGLLTLIATTLTTWPELTVLDLAPGMVVCGLGQGLTAPTLFRVILSGIPSESAGVGSGVLTTTQQSSLALGVAVLGTVFAAVSAQAGMEVAIVVVTVIQATLVAGIALGATRLPRA